MTEISVIVPVYRAEAYLADCIESILAQTFRDFELILVDDGSPDNCAAICREYAARDERIHFLQQKNQGQSVARNQGLKASTGKWICFVDSDDMIHPKMLETLYQGLDHGAGISMCAMLEAPVLPEDFLSRPAEDDFTLLAMDEPTLVKMFDENRYPAWVACAKLIHRAVVECYLFRPGRVFEDNEAVCHWVCQAGRLAITEQPLYYYRTNPESTTKSQFSAKKLDYLWALESILRFYNDRGWEQMAQRFTTLYVQEAADCYRATLQDLHRPELAEEIRKNAVQMFVKDMLPITKVQFETLFDALCPKLIRYYWPLEGAYRTVREEGASGLLKKIKGKFGKGE